ncbi:IS3 family transposase [Mammaliicoccus lentus]|uniref:IS3 family transposase n=1 Tax=Mammaliicoccus lentus TaxID=42858 RepID=UPI002DB91A66|nr:IS3 family transposase [Mammaliicoccus lentus]MEB5686925.1 IS3 family transposase [Mammaliicoccus lentus]
MQDLKKISAFNNVLNQNFVASQPDKKWVADITYIHTKHHGWCYLSSIIDLYSRKVIAYKFSKNMTSQLVVDTLNQAKTTRKISKNLIIHTDLGTQYLSEAVRNWLLLNKIIHSFSRKGYPYDNSVIVSFHAALKKEEVYLKQYDSFEEAKVFIF